MFHKSCYDELGDSLPCDLNGDVPELGDNWEDMAWPADTARRFSESPKSWKTFVEKAAEETRKMTPL